MKDANRSLIYISIMFAVLGVYLLRLFYIQVVDTNYELLSNDNSRRRVVVFPAPLGPNKPVTLPLATLKDTEETARTAP